MRNRSSRRTFLQAGLVVPAAGFIISPLDLQAVLQQPEEKPAPKFQEPTGYTGSGKYGKYVIKESYAKYHQLENVTVTPKQLMVDCIMTHQVFYKPEVIVPAPHSHDFPQIIGLLGSNPMNCREFDAELEFCLGEEQEKHIINVPTVVSLVPGLSHGPITITKINKPFIFLEIMLTKSYSVQKPKPKTA